MANAQMRHDRLARNLSRTLINERYAEWGGVGYYDAWRESGVLLVVAAELQSGPFVPTSTRDECLTAFGLPWSEEKERALAQSLAARVAKCNGTRFSPRNDESAAELVIKGRIVASGLLVKTDPSGEYRVSAAPLAKRRALLDGIACIGEAVLNSIETWARQSLLLSIVMSPFLRDPKFEVLLTRLIRGLPVRGLRAVVSSESGTFHTPRNSWVSGARGYLAAVAWRQGVWLKGVMKGTDRFDWEAATWALMGDTPRFAGDLGAKMPRPLHAAFCIAKSGPSRRTREFEDNLIGDLTEPLANRVLASHECDVALVCEIALSSLLRDALWQRKLLDAASNAVPPFYAWLKMSDAAAHDITRHTRFTRQHFADLIAHHHGSISLWSPLFRKWGVLEHISVTTGPWAARAIVRNREEPIEDVIGRLLVPDSHVVRADLDRITAAVEIDSDEIRTLFAKFPRGPELERQMWIFELIIETASKISSRLLIMASVVVLPFGRGRAGRALRTLCAAEPDKYELLLAELPNELQTRLRAASHPVHSLVYHLHNGRLRRLPQFEAANLGVIGTSATLRGRVTLLHLHGQGSAVKLHTLSHAFVADLDIDRQGAVTEFTGECHFYRIAGRVRTLNAVEAEMARYACRPCSPASETAILRAQTSVADVIELASREPPGSLFASAVDDLLRDPSD